MNDLEKINQTMSHLEIAELTGKSSAHVKKDVESMFDGLDIDRSVFRYTYSDSIGRSQFGYNLQKRECLILISGYSVQLRAKIIDRWDDLERGVTAKVEETQYQKSIIMANAAAEMLRMSDTSKIRMLATICDNHGLPTNILPSYSTETLTRAATDLLKEHGIKLSAMAFNKLMIKAGYLEELSRPSTVSSKIKKFKSLTTAGLEFGKNETSPNNPRETQPLYFEGKFGELLKMIGVSQIK